ncbi:MAG: MarR family transcriptional regulator [Ktedonobacteraceae bacterium]|nr:MarR family transcriptional regulator [Ktedonobacteraceae bacterium]
MRPLPGRSQVELQERLGVEGATMIGLLQRMEHCGLVQRKPDQVDKRMVRVYSSEQGRAKVCDSPFDR